MWFLILEDSCLLSLPQEHQIRYIFVKYNYLWFCLTQIPNFVTTTSITTFPTEAAEQHGWEDRYIIGFLHNQHCLPWYKVGNPNYYPVGHIAADR